MLSRWGLPAFFQNVIGGSLAAILAALAYYGGSEVGIIVRPSMVIAASIIAMLAGLTLTQAIQNGVTFAPVTGNARFFDTLIMTGAIIAGVGIGIELTTVLQFPLPPVETAANPNFASYSIRVLGGACASASYARACYADWSSVGLSWLTAFVGSVLYYFGCVPLGFDNVTGVAVTAIFIGFLGGMLARRYHIPPLIVAIAGITPLLPGLAIYRGMYGILHDQVLVGFSNLALAIATSTALSAGVVFGEWIARRIRRPRGLSRYMNVTKLRSPHKRLFS